MSNTKELKEELIESMRMALIKDSIRTVLTKRIENGAHYNYAGVWIEKDFELILKVFPEEDTFVVVGTYPIRIPKESEFNILQYLNVVNQTIIVGHLEWQPDYQQIWYRTVVHYRGMQLSEGLMRRAYAYTVTTLERNYNMLKKLSTATDITFNMKELGVEYNKNNRIWNERYSL